MALQRTIEVPDSWTMHQCSDEGASSPGEAVYRLVQCLEDDTFNQADIKVIVKDANAWTIYTG